MSSIQDPLEDRGHDFSCVEELLREPPREPALALVVGDHGVQSGRRLCGCAKAPKAGALREHAAGAGEHSGRSGLS